ncbi:MAG: peptidoglycan DD-metalloendopeptidase family protein [Lachnospiraceae bacterium]
MKRRKRIDKFKVASAVLSLAIVGALMFGIVSVVNNVKDNAKRNYNVSESGTNEQNETREYENQVAQKETSEPETKAPEVTEKPTKVNVETQAPTKEQQQVVAPSAAKAEFSFNENDILEWPVKGELVLKYNMESTIYFPTLQQYKCNPAISISAAVNTQVKAAAAGKVVKITRNEETGTTVIMDIGDGYKLTYGQLKDVVVKEGTVCMAGDVIGTVAEPTAYYVVEGANLYFAMEKDGISVDPTLFLAE